MNLSDPAPMTADRATITGRLAPSPTGGLHLGHARTFLAAWLSARSAGGRVVLRVEDLDATRVRAGADLGAIDDLRWLGLDWDEGPDVGGRSAPYLQSQRLPLYQIALERLKAGERIYPCTCTRADIARAASAPHVEDEGPSYPGTCAFRCVADADRLEGQAFAWRFRAPPGPVSWLDLFQGELAVDPSRVGGDFVVARDGHGPSYQLAVAADDAAMGVHQVVRGQDLIPSTPRQILLYLALGWKEPTFGHLPLIVGPDGSRLAKRDGSIKLSTLREAGVNPRSLVGWLARSLGLTDQDGPRKPADLVGSYSPARVPARPFALTTADLAALIAGRLPA